MINLLEELEANVGRTGEAIGNFRKYTNIPRRKQKSPIILGPRNNRVLLPIFLIVLCLVKYLEISGSLFLKLVLFSVIRSIILFYVIIIVPR